MRKENSLIDAALRGWKSNVKRVDKLFGTLSPEQLKQQVNPGKNRLIYLWGHLAAVKSHHEQRGTERPKASRPVSLRALHGVRLQTQNAAAHEIISPKVFGSEPNVLASTSCLC